MWLLEQGNKKSLHETQIFGRILIITFGSKTVNNLTAMDYALHFLFDKEINALHSLIPRM